MGVTWNPSDKAGGITLSGGNLTYTGSGGARATDALSSGKGYWEVLVNQASGDTAWNVGITDAGTTFVSMVSSGPIMFVFLGSGSVSNGGTSLGVSFANGDRVCFAVDFGAKKFWARKNGGNWNNSGSADPATGVGGSTFTTSGPYYPAAASNTVGASYTANFGASAFAQTIPSGFSSVDNLVSITLTPGIVTDTDVFFAPSLDGTNTVTPGIVTDTDTFYAPTVVPGDVSLLPNVVTDNDTFFAPTVTPDAVSLLPALFADTDTFYSPSITASSTLLPSLFVDTDTFYAPTIAITDQTLLPGLVTDSDTFYAPAISGSITLLPSLYTDTDTFYVPVVLEDGHLLPGLVASDDTFYAPTVVPGSITLLPNLVTDVDIVYAASTAAANTLTPSLVASDDVVHSPAVTAGSVTLTPFRFTDTDLFYSPSVAIGNTLLPQLFVDTDVFRTPTVARAVLPSLLVDADTFYAPTIHTSSLTLLPSRYVDPDIFYTAFIAIVQKHGNGGGGGPGTLPGNIKYSSPLTMPSAGLITTIETQSLANTIVNARMMIYANLATNLPGALLGQTNVKSAITIGANDFQLIVPVAVTANQRIWIALQTDGSISWALQNVTGGSKFNNDLFSDGPSDPFGTTSNDNKQAPVFVYFLTAANASMLPNLVTDPDTFLAPAVGRGTITLLPSLVDESEIIWTPVTVTSGPYPLYEYVIFTDDDIVYSPVVVSTITIFPGLVDDSVNDVFYDPAIGRGDVGVVFTSKTPDDDIFYPPTVITEGANLLPTKFTDTDVFYTPVVSTSKTLFPSFVNNAEVLHTITVTKTNYAVTPALDDEQDVFFPPVVTYTGGTVTLAPSLVVDTDDFLPPSLGGERWTRNVYLEGDVEDVNISALGEVSDT